MADFPNQVTARRAQLKRDVFVENEGHPITRPETVDPSETFPIETGTVMARSTLTNMLVRYADGGLEGADTAVGMLYREVFQPPEADHLTSPIATGCNIVIHGVAINGEGIANLTDTARAQLMALGVYAYRNADVGSL